jgi:hypothetical protein
VTFFSTVAASEGLDIWTVTREMTNLLAATALDAFSRARLGAFTRGMTGLLAVAAGKRVNTLLLTVTGPVADLIADSTLDLHTGGELGSFFLAVLLNVALKTCQQKSGIGVS